MSWISWAVRAVGHTTRMPKPASASARAGLPITATAIGTRISRRAASPTTALSASSSVTAATASQPATAPSRTARSSAGAVDGAPLERRRQPLEARRAGVEHSHVVTRAEQVSGERAAESAGADDQCPHVAPSFHTHRRNPALRASSAATTTNGTQISSGHASGSRGRV